LSQLVNELYEFPLSYNHNILNQRTFTFCVGVSPPSHCLTPVCFTNIRTLF